MTTTGRGAGGQDELWERESLRLCDRYVREVVLAFDLCPWADAALRGGRVRQAVCLSATPTVADCRPFVDRLRAAEEPPLDIGLLLFPRHAGGPGAFDGFAERVRRDDRPPRFLVAAFHPGGSTSFKGPHQLTSFLRRTPDPMLQFVRGEMIELLKKNQPDVSEAVGRRNHDALTLAAAAGAARLDAVVRAIRADRDSTYARLSDRPGDDSGPDST